MRFFHIPLKAEVEMTAALPQIFKTKKERKKKKKPKRISNKCVLYPDIILYGCAVDRMLKSKN